MLSSVSYISANGERQWRGDTMVREGVVSFCGATVTIGSTNELVAEE